MRDLIEDVLIDVSRAQREAIDRHMRHLLVLLDAGVTEDEAQAILADCGGEEVRRAA